MNQPAAGNATKSVDPTAHRRRFGVYGPGRIRT
jgi:hypothetical protein